MLASPRLLDASAAPGIEALYSAAHSLHAQGRYAHAADVFRLMLGCAPVDERPWLGLGECHEKIDQLRIALELYSAGTVAADPAPRCMLARARVLKKLDRDEESAEALDAAAQLAARLGDDELARVVEQENRGRA